MNNDATSRTGGTIMHFDPDHKMTGKAREKLLSTALLSLKSFKIQNWHFVVVDDPEQRKWIRDAAWGQAQVTEASMLIILCTDLNAWEEEPPHCWHPLPEAFQEFTIPAMRSCFSELDRMQRDEVMRSCGIAAQALVLSAQSMGYDACPLNGFDGDAVGDLINLPEDHAVCMFVAIGKNLGENRTGEQTPPLDEIVIKDSF